MCIPQVPWLVAFFYFLSFGSFCFFSSFNSLVVFPQGVKRCYWVSFSFHRVPNSVSIGSFFYSHHAQQRRRMAVHFLFVLGMLFIINDFDCRGVIQVFLSTFLVVALTITWPAAALVSLVTNNSYHVPFSVDTSVLLSPPYLYCSVYSFSLKLLVLLLSL